MWVIGIELKLLGLVASVLTCWTILLVLNYILIIILHFLFSYSPLTLLNNLKLLFYVCVVCGVRGVYLLVPAVVKRWYQILWRYRDKQLWAP